MGAPTSQNLASILTFEVIEVATLHSCSLTLGQSGPMNPNMVSVFTSTAIKAITSIVWPFKFPPSNRRLIVSRSSWLVTRKMTFEDSLCRFHGHYCCHIMLLLSWLTFCVGIEVVETCSMSIETSDHETNKPGLKDLRQMHHRHIAAKIAGIF